MGAVSNNSATLLGLQGRVAAKSNAARKKLNPLTPFVIDCDFHCAIIVVDRWVRVTIYPPRPRNCLNFRVRQNPANRLGQNARGCIILIFHEFNRQCGGGCQLKINCLIGRQAQAGIAFKKLSCPVNWVAGSQPAF